MFEVTQNCTCIGIGEVKQAIHDVLLHHSLYFFVFIFFHEEIYKFIMINKKWKTA